MLSAFKVATLLTTCAGLAAGAVLDVWNPLITSPTNGTVWVTGAQVNVTWNAAGGPAEVTNPTGQVVLVVNGRLQLDSPLAQDFSLTQGWTNLTVPDVPPGMYNIVLFGDSGNESQSFVIIPSTVCSSGGSQ